MSFRNRTPAARRRATSDSMVFDDEMDAVPSARCGLAAVGHRAACRALRSAQQQTQITADDVREGRRGIRAQRETEMRRVEGDRRLDVVDHVANIDSRLGHYEKLAGLDSRRVLAVF